MSSHDDIMKGLGLHGQAVVATIETMVEQGRQEPDLSHIAARVGVPVGDLRQIFPDNQSLLIAVAEQALVRLMDSCTKAVVKIDPNDVVAQLLAIGKAYVRWASDYRVQFRLITSHPLLDAMQIPQLRRYLDSVNALMTKMLLRAHSEGHLRDDEDIAMIVLSSQTFAYGLARMVVDGRMKGLFPQEDPLEAADYAMVDFVRRFARAAAKRPSRAKG